MSRSLCPSKEVRDTILGSGMEHGMRETWDALDERKRLQVRRMGIAYLTENRRTTIFPRHEVYKNITLAHLDHLVRPVFRHPAEVAVAPSTFVTRTLANARLSLSLTRNALLGSAVAAL